MCVCVKGVGIYVNMTPTHNSFAWYSDEEMAIVGDTSYVGLERLNIILQPGTILWISIMILTYTISALHADLCNIFLCNLSLWNI